MQVPKYRLPGWWYPREITVHQKRYRTSYRNNINGTNVYVPDAFHSNQVRKLNQTSENYFIFFKYLLILVTLTLTFNILTSESIDFLSFTESFICIYFSVKQGKVKLTGNYLFRAKWHLRTKRLLYDPYIFSEYKNRQFNCCVDTYCATTLSDFRKNLMKHDSFKTFETFCSFTFRYTDAVLSIIF